MAHWLIAVQDRFWGDRYGTFTDPFGHTWGMVTHKEDFSKEKLEERAEAFWASMQEAVGAELVAEP